MLEFLVIAVGGVNILLMLALLFIALFVPASMLVGEIK